MSSKRDSKVIVDRSKDTFIILQNFLEKQSPTISKAWQRRWFILRGPQGFVQYFRGSDLAGEFELHYHTKISNVVVRKDRSYFDIQVGERIFKFRCDDDNLARKWVEECGIIIKTKSQTTISLEWRKEIAPPLTTTSANSFRTTVDPSTFSTSSSSTSQTDIETNTINGKNNKTSQSSIRVRGRSGSMGNIVEEPVATIPNASERDPRGYMSGGDEVGEEDEEDETTSKFIAATMRGKKVGKMLGLSIDNEESRDEFQYRASVRYMMEKHKVGIDIKKSPGPKTDNCYRILALDGGGLRGIMHSVLLERICKKFPSFLDHVDLFSGTSGGAIVAASLAANFPPAFAREIFNMGGSTVFSKKTIKNVSTAKYTSKWLKITVEEIIGDKQLNDLERKLVIPAFQLDNFNPFQPDAPRCWEPKLFHNIGKTSAGHVCIYDALLRTIAAPTYFPAHQGYIDGGMFAHNPALSAISLAINPQFENKKVDEVLVLSLGTGRMTRYLPTDGPETYDWGLVQWAPKMIDLLLDAQVTHTTAICENMLGPDHYHRLDHWLAKGIPMDDPSLLQEIATRANEMDLSKTFTWIENHFMPKTENKITPVKNIGFIDRRLSAAGFSREAPS
eukprot:TRINITY_DN1224_c0_g1_i2.p1 TRINITY_DN1224_c0_g1~~TRINITY_DN1224_c0_g1_i2.p1  ORF type:complete len:618 (-),score=110.00 TRINITY_DN1224_c0_g1_i2:108-1961(-)